MGSISPFSTEQLIPQEEKLEIQNKKDELFIGIPKESYLQEKRVSLTPDAVSALTAHGHRVVIESGAGEGANYTDEEYSNAGAKVSYDIKEAFECNIVLKVEPPTFEEIELMTPQSVLFSALQLKTQSKKYFKNLAKKRITAIAYDYIKDNSGSYPVVRSLSEIAGTASIHIASEIMGCNNTGNGMLLGNISGVPPTSVVILGAGTVGEAAARSAIGLGARVKVFDNSLTKLRQLQYNIGSQVYTSTVQPKTLQKALMRCDIAIGAIKGNARTPIIVTETMVSKMKTGAVIVDVSIDRGGCFETSEVTTHKNPTYQHLDVVHYCVPNIPSKYSRTASISISNIFTPYLLDIADAGGVEKALRTDKSLQHGLYFYHGILTNKDIGDWFDLPYRDINLLIL